MATEGEKQLCGEPPQHAKVENYVVERKTQPRPPSCGSPARARRGRNKILQQEGGKGHLLPSHHSEVRGPLQ